MQSHLSWRVKSSASLPTDSAEPLFDLRAVDVVVVDPVFVAGVVGRVDIDALDLAGVVREQRLEGFEVVALHEQVAGFGVAGAAGFIAMQQPVGDVAVVVDDRLLADPVQGGRIAVEILVAEERRVSGLAPRAAAWCS